MRSSDPLSRWLSRLHLPRSARSDVALYADHGDDDRHGHDLPASRRRCAAKGRAPASWDKAGTASQLRLAGFLAHVAEVAELVAAATQLPRAGTGGLRSADWLRPLGRSQTALISNFMLGYDHFSVTRASNRLMHGYRLGADQDRRRS